MLRLGPVGKVAVGEQDKGRKRCVMGFGYESKLLLRMSLCQRLINRCGYGLNVRMTDEELMRFCAANEMVRVERDANGELILMSPSGSGTGHKNSELIYQLGGVGAGDELWCDVRFKCRIYAAGWIDAEPRCGLDCVAAMECAE